MRQIRRPANELFREIANFGLGKFRNRNRLIIGKKIQQSLKILFGNRFIEADPDGVVIEKPEIDQGFGRLCEDRASPLAELSPGGYQNADRVPTSKPSFSKPRASLPTCRRMRSAICFKRFGP